MRDAIGPTAAFDARFGAETQCYRSPGERPERHKRTAASKPRPAARYLVSNLKSEHPYYTREMKATRNDKYFSQCCYSSFIKRYLCTACVPGQYSRVCSFPPLQVA